jgi:hypothetical protein
MVAIREGDALFIYSAGMRELLESNAIATLTAAGNWPTPETAALWKRFRDETLSGGIQTINVSEVRRGLAAGYTRPANGVYRVEVDDATGEAWVCTPDYRRIAKLRRRLRDPARGLLTARFTRGDERALVRRSGSGNAEWLDAAV